MNDSYKMNDSWIDHVIPAGGSQINPMNPWDIQYVHPDFDEKDILTSPIDDGEPIAAEIPQVFANPLQKELQGKFYNYNNVKGVEGFAFGDNLIEVLCNVVVCLLLIYVIFVLVQKLQTA